MAKKKYLIILSTCLCLLVFACFGNSSIAYGKNSNSYYLETTLKYINRYNLYETQNTTTTIENMKSTINSWNGIKLLIEKSTSSEDYFIIRYCRLNYFNTSSPNNINSQNTGNYYIDNNGIIHTYNGANTNWNLSTQEIYKFGIGPFGNSSGYIYAKQVTNANYNIFNIDNITRNIYTRVLG